ncbi:MAG: hypothetical protein ABIN13_15505 [Mucilaginibacter sp.]
MKPIPAQLQLQLSLKNLLIFQFFFFLMHELHEQVHVIIGRILCGCWATRDFNVWQLCDSCSLPYSVAATFAGPVFTFAMLWLGRHWLRYGKSSEIKSLGLVFIFGNMPFGRMYMAATGSGDEVFGLRELFINADHSNLWLIRLVGFTIVAAICVPPLVTAYLSITNKWRVLIFIALLIIPLGLDTVILLIFLNGLLQRGILNQVVVMGMPLMITVWLVVCGGIVGLGWRCLRWFGLVREV